MTYLKPFRKLFIKSTNLTHSYQGKDQKLLGFYKLWSYIYDLSVGIDPAFGMEMKKMISAVVQQGDTTLDIGCGTGISTLYAATIASKVIGIDLSPQMIAQLEQKINRKKISDIELITGSFPEDLPRNLAFNSIISSFAIVHFTPEQRKSIYKYVFNRLVSNGRLGLFSAQGEIASSFETEKEVITNLELAGFINIETNNVSDIYRIITTKKP